MGKIIQGGFCYLFIWSVIKVLAVKSFLSFQTSIFASISNLMSHTDLSLRFRENRANGLGKTIEGICGWNQNIRFGSLIPYHELLNRLKHSSKSWNFRFYRATFREVLSYHQVFKVFKSFSSKKYSFRVPSSGVYHIFLTNSQQYFLLIFHVFCKSNE